MGQILIGISSWSEPELVKSGFYPMEVKTPAERLRYYASQFSIAEIDSTYHYFATQRNLTLWLDNAPKGFTFDVRAFSLLTQHPTPLASLPRSIREKYGGEVKPKGNIYPHHLPEAVVDEVWAVYIRTLEFFQNAGKLGAVLFQFPPWFHTDPKNMDYIASCRERLAGYQMAVEFRTACWLEEQLEETLKFLSKQKIALVCVDEPQGLKSSVPPVAEVTAPLAFIRFHGRNKETWEARNIPATERFNYLYKKSELEAWAARATSMAEKAKELHIIFKNKHADYPVRNALQMKELLGLVS